jgi:energy-coupling factor transporter ATP-binding protein EcfA2
MYKYRIDEIIFKNGYKMVPKSLIIFVGPNNSGKSRILKELLGLSTNPNAPKIILKNIKYKLPKSWDELIDSYKVKCRIDNLGNYIYEDCLNTTFSGDSSLSIRQCN